jgi:hypothetical protein
VCVEKRGDLEKQEIDFLSVGEAGITVQMSISWVDINGTGA